MRSGKTNSTSSKIINDINDVLRRQCPEVFVVRKTLTQLAEEASLTEDKRLMVEGREVAVIYMRWVTNTHKHLSCHAM